MGSYRQRHRNFGSAVCKLPADTASADSRTVDDVDVAMEAVALSTWYMQISRTKNGKISWSW